MQVTSEQRVGSSSLPGRAQFTLFVGLPFPTRLAERRTWEQNGEQRWTFSRQLLLRFWHGYWQVQVQLCAYWNRPARFFFLHLLRWGNVSSLWAVSGRKLSGHGERDLGAGEIGSFASPGT